MLVFQNFGSNYLDKLFSIHCVGQVRKIERVIVLYGLSPPPFWGGLEPKCFKKFRDIMFVCLVSAIYVTQIVQNNYNLKRVKWLRSVN